MIKITDIILLILALIYLGFSIWYHIAMNKIVNDIKNETKNDKKC